ncbi:5'-nucleotidase C-terminal domain-containing protein [Nocardioidaceae bacterium]|nr:5'-nucleotidase C-terminal domain-containing protein [Nocardioidaceae bacterium]
MPSRTTTRAPRRHRSGLAAAAVTALTAGVLAVPAAGTAAPAPTSPVPTAGTTTAAAAATALERRAKKDKSKGKKKGENKRQGQALRLTILHNNDGESQLLGAPGAEDFGGIARFKTLSAQLKKEARTGRSARQGGLKRAAVMLSSGDNFLAGPEFTASLEKGVPFYDSIGLDAVGYDAMAIGNHEFDFGPDVLADFITGFGADAEDRPPFVSANLDVSEEASLAALKADGTIVRRTVVKKRGERIGIVGATTPALRSVSSPRDVVVRQAVAAIVQNQVDALSAKGVNKVILISHLQSILEDQDLVSRLQGVDIAIAGGGDELLANEGDLLVPGDEISVGLDGEPLSYPQYATDATDTEVPIVTTAGDYKYVGRLIVKFNRKGELVKVGERSGPVRVSGVAPDAVAPNPFVQRAVVEPVQAYVDQLAETVLADAEEPLDGTRNAVRSMETNLGNLLADALLYAGRQNAAEFGVVEPDVALQNAGGIRNGAVLEPGDFTALDAFDVAPFTNFVSVVPGVSRSQFKEILENAVSAPAGETGISPDGQFAQVAGFSFVYDLSGQAQEVNDAGDVLTPGTRVQTVTLDDGTVLVENGQVVEGAPIAVATNDFSARGGDQYPFRGLDFTTVGVTYQQALADYVAEGLGGVVTAEDYPAGGEGRITAQ